MRMGRFKFVGQLLHLLSQINIDCPDDYLCFVAIRQLALKKAMFI